MFIQILTSIYHIPGGAGGSGPTGGVGGAGGRGTSNFCGLPAGHGTTGGPGGAGVYRRSFQGRSSYNITGSGAGAGVGAGGMGGGIGLAGSGLGAAAGDYGAGAGGGAAASNIFATYMSGMGGGGTVCHGQGGYGAVFGSRFRSSSTSYEGSYGNRISSAYDRCALTFINSIQQQQS